jgi:alpha-ketoglutarate-dependent 2,4-dichlorophenoxyacetate dioxygenase
VEFESIHPEFGAKVTGVELSMNLSCPEFETINHAINQYSVLVFPNQALDDNSHLAFTRLFGDLEEEHVSYYSRGEVTYIGTVGNIDACGKPRDNRNRRVKSQTGNQMWHSDSSFREIPSLYSILFAYEVPGKGGDTEFISCRAAYSRLDKETQSIIEPLIGIHDYIYSRTKVSEDAVTGEQRIFMHPVRQRLVRMNPVTGEKNFYIGSHVRDIIDWSTEESRTLLDKLMNEATRPESIYRHQWQVGDLVIWDNRCILHRGCGYDADRYRRRMHQTRVRGMGPSLAESV